MVTLGLVDDDLFLRHEAPPGHPEREARIHAARRGFESVRGHFETTHLAPRDATDAELTTTHTPEHVARVASTADSSGNFDADTYYCARSHAAARRAAGGCVALVDALGMNSEAGSGLDYGFALVRPPGHHATANLAMGFCLFNNVAVAAHAALARGREKIAIVDWDVHHGNGTQDLFYTNPNLLYISTHQSPQYPGTGRATETGLGAGTGFTVNLPLSAGATDTVYRRVFDTIVCPVLKQYRPELLLISAGYDAHRRDPLGGMAVSNEGFGMMTRRLLACLPDDGRGRVAFVLEGGYDEDGLEGAVRHSLLALVEPSTPEAEDDDLTQVRSAELERLLNVHRQYWTL